MPYTTLGQYQPALLLQNIIDATTDTPRYQLILPFLRDLKVKVEEAAASSSTTTAGSQCQHLLDEYGGHTGLTCKQICEVLGLYANTSLGRTLGAVLNLFVKLCSSRSYVESQKLYVELIALLRQAQSIVKEFHGSGNMWMLEEGLSVLGEEWEEKLLGMRKHVRAMEVCVEGMRVWGDMIGQ